MAKTRPSFPCLNIGAQGKASAASGVESYTLPGSGLVLKVGDCVLIKSEDPKVPFVARIESFDFSNPEDVKVRGRWYFLPCETFERKQSFHGDHEIFLSSLYGDLNVNTIDGTCNVHSMDAYCNLKNRGAEDYFCRFYYDQTTGAFNPDHVQVYCLCEKPYNPDLNMLECCKCENWYHLNCVEISIDEAEKIEYVCPECKGQKVLSTSPTTDVKGVSSRRRR